MAVFPLSVARPLFVHLMQHASVSCTGGRSPTHLSAERPRYNRQIAHDQVLATRMGMPGGGRTRSLHVMQPAYRREAVVAIGAKALKSGSQVNIARRLRANFKCAGDPKWVHRVVRHLRAHRRWVARSGVL
jgi:hypothetical protein